MLLSLEECLKQPMKTTLAERLHSGNQCSQTNFNCTRQEKKKEDENDDDEGEEKKAVGDDDDDDEK